MTPLRKHSGKRVFGLADTLRFSCFRRCVYNGTGTPFYMFPTDFRFRNHVFPQPLTCVYVAETRNSATEICYFVPSSGGNVKILSGNLTGFSVFPSVSVVFTAYIKYVQKVSHLRKPSFPVGIFLNSYMKLTFEYFSLRIFFPVNLHAVKTYSLYTFKSDKCLYRKLVAYMEN